MSDPTQTVHIELERETVELALSDWPQTTGAQATVVAALRSALSSSPEHQGASFIEIDAEEFEEARRDPRTKALLEAADRYAAELGARGSSSPEQGGEGGSGPVVIRRDADDQLHVESPYRRLDSFEDPAEQFWPASVARFQGESAEHWHQSATYWQEQAEAARKAQPPAPALSDEQREAIDWAKAEERLRNSVSKLHEIQAELEERDESWMATRLSYVAGGITNLCAYPPRTLASQEQGEEDEQLAEEVQPEDTDDLCKCGHARHEHRYYPDPECGPETGSCAYCGCEKFTLATPESQAAELRSLAEIAPDDQARAGLEKLASSLEPEHLERPEVPEEAVEEAAGWLRWTTKSDDCSERARRLVAAIAPALRKQEWERVRGALGSDEFKDRLADAIDAAYAEGFNTGPPDYEPISASRLFENPTHMRKVVAIQKAARQAALDSLEDPE